MSAPSGRSDALLIVDPQNDFCPGGALAVPAGDRIFAVLNRLAAALPRVVASQDWHPPDHLSFSVRGGPWPVHCVADTGGAAFHPALDRARIDMTVRKGTERDVEAYSAFSGTGLEDWLREQGVERLIVGGLATDYCVLNTVLDARRLGFQVVVVEDAVAAVDVQPGDGSRALAKMREAGAQVVASESLVPAVS